ncbi:hypothetical protein [uncultured Novosphingobium sp.]|uniref:hypothetical protein n=1 Tax=uncultured Novosphingobium sp. TaxID=292277 RepID=UPI003747C968
MAAWFFGVALSGAIGVPFWRTQPYGDGFDVSLTAAVAMWFLIGAIARPYRVTNVVVDRTGITVVERPA